MNSNTSSLEQELQRIENKITETQNLVKQNPDLQELVQEEINNLNVQKKALEDSIYALQNPSETRSDSNDSDGSTSKDAIVEIRAAAGGDEAGLFAGDLYRMYTRYAENQGWRINQLYISEGGIGNLKEVSFEILGKNDNPAYPKLQYESGVHRVQRVPSTESGGRIHTSTATVAVLPKISPQEIELNMQELRFETFRSRGPGGQSVNTTDSAVRITHIPTGISVRMQDEKSQHKNREKALEVLSSRLFIIMQEQQKEKVDQLRMDQIGTGERSEKIRTYNFPQNRITDHRVNESWHNLPAILGVDIDGMVGTIREKLSADNPANLRSGD
jgi:peptide chain release factor 1